MSEQVVQSEPAGDVPEDVTLADVLEVLEVAQSDTNDRLDYIGGQVRDVALALQSEEGTSAVVRVDDSQWVEVTSSLSETRDIASMSMFVGVLCVCVLSAILGTRLFSEFTRGWRR